MSFPLNQGLSSCIKIFRSSESLHIYHMKHLNTETVTIKDITSTHFTVLLSICLAGIREVVSFLTKSDVGWDTICSKGGGFQIAGSVPTERGTGLTSKKERTLKFSIPIEVEGSYVPCRLRLRGVVVVVGLTLFLGGFSSEDKTKEVGLAALFLSAVDFPFLSVPWGVRLNPVSKSSKFVFSDVNTGGGENSHLFSLRNAWRECIGVAGGVLSLSSKDSSCIPGDGIIGRKGSLSFKKYCSIFLNVKFYIILYIIHVVCISLVSILPLSSL